MTNLGEGRHPPLVLDFEPTARMAEGEFSLAGYRAAAPIDARPIIGRWLALNTRYDTSSSRSTFAAIFAGLLIASER